MRSASRFRALILSAGYACFLLTGMARAATVYVDAHATGANNGTTWADAFVELQAGLAAAQASDEIWLADGTYTPVPAGGARTVSFQLRNGVAIYGGFAGTETSRDQRDWMANASILSGADSSYHVVDGSGTDATAVLDGVIVSGGKADLYRSGGGLYVDAGSPTIRNCLFRDNYADQYGGGAYYANSTGARVTNCRFVGNRTDSSPLYGASGGGLYCTATDLLLVNCTFSANLSAGYGYALDVEFGQAMVVNCTFMGNPPNGRGATINASASTSIVNCIVWGSPGAQIQGTPAVTYSCVQGGYAGVGNIDRHPLLRYPEDPDAQQTLWGFPHRPREGNLELLGNSPCINAGLTSAVPPDLITDLNGDPRVTGSAVDMGALEFQVLPNVPSRLYVKASATGSGDGSSWENAIPQLRDAMPLAYTNRDVVLEIWVAQGTYTPSANGAEYWASFVIAPGVNIYGGFDGTESALDQRDWNAHRTVLSGDLNGDDGPGFANTGENSNNVVVAPYLAEGTPAVMDGLTITAGNAFLHGCSPTYFYDRPGGGVCQLDGTVVARNCSIISNQAIYGSGWWTAGGSFQLYNCLLAGNSTTDFGTLTVWGSGTNPSSMVNCTVAGNQAEYTPTEIYLRTGGLNITNCIVWNPTADATVQEISGAATVTHSCVRTGYAGTGNMTADPQFVSPGSDYRLLPFSPCVNAGSNEALPADLTQDLAGKARIAAGTVDMGAYEFNGQAASGRLYVRRGALGNNDGTSWTDAMIELTQALQYVAARPGTIQEIWVAEGTYKPAEPGGDRNASFVLPANVPMYGGFAGSESDLNERDWAAHPTILSGDLNGNDGPNSTNMTENSYRIVTAIDLPAGSTATLDGFTVKGSYYNRPTSTAIGAQNSSLVVRHCRITGNSSPNAPAFQTTNGQLTLAETSIDANGSKTTIALASANGTNITLDRCVVADNLSVGIILTNCSVEARNCLFTGQRSYHLRLDSASSASITNCTFAGGLSIRPALMFSRCTPVVTNCIFWDHLSPTGYEITPGANVTYSCVQGGYPGTGNLSSPPYFVNAANGDYRLLAGSPCFNAGSNAAVPPEMTTDLAGGTRILGGIVDMGAYELVPPCFTVAEQPQSGQTCHDRPYQLCAAASGDGPFTYQWQKDGVDVPGANDACYQASESGRYRCRISNSCAQVLTYEATVTVRQCGFGDFDGDGDVDQADFGTLQACFGPVADGSSCQQADLDASGSVSTGDLEIFVGCSKGPGVDLDTDCRP